MAARLVEKGVPFVELHLNGWDTHSNNFAAVAGRAASLDPAVAELLRELRRKGLLESTLVMVTGEFGRTPRINRNVGRDHFPRCFSVLLAGRRHPRRHRRRRIHSRRQWKSTTVRRPSPISTRRRSRPCASIRRRRSARRRGRSIKLAEWRNAHRGTRRLISLRTGPPASARSFVATRVAGWDRDEASVAARV